MGPLLLDSSRSCHVRRCQVARQTEGLRISLGNSISSIRPLNSKNSYSFCLRRLRNELDSRSRHPAFLVGRSSSGHCEWVTVSIVRTRNRCRCSCERFWSSSSQGVIRRFSPLELGGTFRGWPFVRDQLSVPLGLVVMSSRRCRELSSLSFLLASR